MNMSKELELGNLNDFDCPHKKLNVLDPAEKGVYLEFCCNKAWSYRYVCYECAEELDRHPHLVRTLELD